MSRAVIIDEIDHHRNGIGGAPFHVVRFTSKETGERPRRMVAVVFGKADYVAVLDVDLLASGDIRFGSNSWRGDNFEPELRKAIAAHERMIGDDEPSVRDRSR